MTDRLRRPASVPLFSMRAVILDSALLAARARLGHDRFDEMWDGELHMVPPPSHGHQLFGTRLLIALAPWLDHLGLIITYETGFFRTADDYRQPDLAIYRRDQTSDRGIEAAELVIEIRSPSDETLQKLPWYLARRCREVLIVDRDTLAVELHTSVGVVKGARSDVLGCSFATVAGPAVRVTWDDREVTIDHR